MESEISNSCPDDWFSVFKTVSEGGESSTKQDQPVLEKESCLEIDNKEICSECKSEDSFVYNDGAYFCFECGVFQEVRIQQDQEWRYYGDSDSKSSDPTRVGMPTNNLLPESSLGTMISNKGRSSKDYDKIRQYHIWNTMPYKERSLYRMYERVQNKAIHAGIPPYIIDNAKSLYKDISEIHMSRGSNRRGIMGTCVFIACKLEGVPRSAKEIADIYNIQVNELTRGVKTFSQVMNSNKTDKSLSVQSSNPVNFIQRFCSKLQLQQDIRYLCEYVAFMATKYDIVDENTPPSVAAGSIFLVISLCKLGISKKSVSNACKISEVTISKCFKKLGQYSKKLIPDDAIKKYNISFD